MIAAEKEACARPNEKKSNSRGVYVHAVKLA